MTAFSPVVELDGFVSELLAFPTRAARRRRLKDLLPTLAAGQVNALAEALKEALVRCLWTDVEAAQEAVDLLRSLARLTGDELIQALALRARAQTLMIGFGEHQRALRLYRRALAIYQRRGDELGQALVYLTSVWAMANTGQYNQALITGEWAGQVLRERGEWRSYATLQNNLAAIHNRSYDYQLALECTERACQGYQAMGEPGRPFLANSEVNRVLALAALGRFAEAVQAGERALDLSSAYDQKIVYLRAQRNLACCHILMGQYNQALDLLELARQAHAAAGQPHEAAQCELAVTDCLLELNRLDAVLEKCREVLPLFNELGMRLEAAETAHNQALAYRRLGRIEDSIAALQTVRGLFAEEALDHWVAQTDTEIAQLHLRAGRPELAQPLAQACVDRFARLGLPHEQTQAQLVTARAALSQGDRTLARELGQAALNAAGQGNWPGLVFQANHLLARCAAAQGEASAALDYNTRAIEALEQLRSQVMFEFRAGFLEERETVYSEAVALCLDQNDPRRAFALAERSRSRALLELLSGQEALRLRARRPEDLPLVNQIQQLTEERQKFVRRLDYLALDVAPRAQEETLALQQRVLALEKQITERWHQLLVHTAAYTEDPAYWALQPEPDPCAVPLQPGTLLLAYYDIGESFILFLARKDHPADDLNIQTVRLTGNIKEVERLIQVLHLNLRAAAKSLNSANTAAFESSARQLLQRLYALLLAPVEKELAAADRLVIIPHGPLHYLPFQALHNGQRYLVETHRTRILPAASFLYRQQAGRPSAASVLVMGHSYQGNLKHALKEARQVASLWGSQPVLEQDATLERLRADASACRLLHLACHGDFRADNPLFSGLALEDGWLTTLDIYNLRLNASLVTLSACQTGRTVPGGGGELFGLMRALLTAGAASLVLSLWPVSDESAAHLMDVFYSGLAAGEDKETALRQAQLSLLQSGDEDVSTCQHPYFWAPFFLIGEGGPL